MWSFSLGLVGLFGRNHTAGFGSCQYRFCKDSVNCGFGESNEEVEIRNTKPEKRNHQECPHAAAPFRCRPGRKKRRSGELRKEEVRKRKTHSCKTKPVRMGLLSEKDRVKSLRRVDDVPPGRQKVKVDAE
jgi:hypothetical protein